MKIVVDVLVRTFSSLTARSSLRTDHWPIAPNSVMPTDGIFQSDVSIMSSRLVEISKDVVNKTTPIMTINPERLFGIIV